MKARNRVAMNATSVLFSLVLCFAVLLLVQELLAPKSKEDGTGITTAYRYLDERSLDVLFVGPSQMFCAIDAGRLTDEYGIDSFDYGASSQPLPTTAYYRKLPWGSVGRCRSHPWISTVAWHTLPGKACHA